MVCSRGDHGCYRRNGLLDIPCDRYSAMKRSHKDALTYGVIQDAMNEARRLKATYPKGLTTQDLCKELGLENPRSARSVMNRPGFTQWDNLYKVTDVAAALAHRHYYANKRRT